MATIGALSTSMRESQNPVVLGRFRAAIPFFFLSALSMSRTVRWRPCQHDPASSPSMAMRIARMCRLDRRR
jgi:hypothetical protein